MVDEKKKGPLNVSGAEVFSTRSYSGRFLEKQVA